MAAPIQSVEALPSNCPKCGVVLVLRHGVWPHFCPDCGADLRAASGQQREPDRRAPSTRLDIPAFPAEDMAKARGLPRAVGVAVAALGLVVLLASLLHAMFSQSDEVLRLEGDIRGLRIEIKGAKLAAEDAGKEAEELEATLASARAEADEAVAEIAPLEEELAEIRGAQKDRVEAARESLQESRAAMTADKAAVKEAREDGKTEEALRDLLARYQRSVVTIVSNKGQVGTGFLVAAGRQPQVLTSNEAAPYG